MGCFTVRKGAALERRGWEQAGFVSLSGFGFCTSDEKSLSGTPSVRGAPLSRSQATGVDFSVVMCFC